ncbi:condensation domain-containing protein, partial [Chitinophaga sp. CF118]|uniref:non-ribosomal peptide synthetase n=1 Tax=Chitinophaga sp. CF118 TaxID=1884367 RepID=UPI002100D8FA
MPGVFVFEGELDLALLEYAFDELIARHESLRTIFREDEQGEVRQVILDTMPFNIAGYDMQTDEVTLKSLLQQAVTAPFDLSTGPLLRAGLYQAGTNKWIFTCTMHHIISDGWSMNVLIKELLLFYNTASNPLSPLKIQYKDYASWQQDQLNSAALQIHKNYWLEQFSGELPVLELPSDKLRPSVKTYHGGIIHHTFSKTISAGIKALIQQEGGTLFMGLLSAINTLLYHYTGQEDIIIGSPIAGREHIDLEEQIGFYVNTLALRARFSGKDSYRELLENVKQITLGAYEHQIYPFDELVDALPLKVDMSRNALFDVMVVLQNNEEHHLEGEQSLKGVMISEYKEVDQHISKFDLQFTFAEKADALQLTITYNSDIYEHATGERMACHLEQLLCAIIADPSMAIDQLDYLSNAEKTQLLVDFNGAAGSYPRNKTLTTLFEEQVTKTPDAIALVFAGKEFSYQSLNSYANQLGAYLRNHYQIQPDDLIGIKLERSEWMIISLLGVLKSGGAYVPIDPEYPQERIDYMLTDSQCKVLIDEAELEKFRQQASLYSKNNQGIINRPTDLAYVIYTSGSTGQPKGCMLEHQGVINRIEWMWHQYEFTAADIILQKTTFTFDVSVWELFMPLCWGAKMVLCQREDTVSPDRILSLISKEGVSCLHFVPGMLNVFITSLFDGADIKDAL